MVFRGVISYRSFFGTAESVVILGVVFFFCSYSAYARAGQVRLAWNASTTSGVAGYQLSYGRSSGNYTSKRDVGNKTRYTLTGLQGGKKYYIAAKAYNSGKTKWSGYSNEVTKTIPTSSTAPTGSFSANPTSGVAPLTVTGSSGSSTATKTTTAAAAAPVANFTASRASVSSGGVIGGGNSGLVAAYNFEEESGTIVADASGQGNKGSITGALRVTRGRFGKALSFDGVNDWVTVNDAASLDLTTGMTLEAWYYPTVDMSDWSTALLKENPSHGLVYGLYANTDTSQPAGSAYVGGNKNLHGGPWLFANTWVHLATTYNGSTQRLYVNGTEVANRAHSGSIEVSNGALRIGGNSVWGEFFKGRIDEVRIYNSALSATEIQTDMSTSVATSSPPVTLVGTETVGSVTDSNPQGKAEAFRTTAATTGVVTSLSVYVDSGSTASKLVAGLYTDSNGHPGTRLARGTLSSPGSGGWKKVSIPPVSTNAGSKYWIALLGPGGVLQFRDSAGGTSQPSETSAQTTLTTLPSTWSTGTAYSSGPLSAYGAGYP